MEIPKKFQKAYTRSNYRLIGKAKHSALKPCHWMIAKLETGRNNKKDPVTGESIGRNCYKGYFGIESEGCVQCTPALPYCNHNCVFCWRDVEKGSLGGHFTIQPDEPAHLVDEFIRNQINLLDHHFPLKGFLQNYDLMEDILSYLKKNANHFNQDEFHTRSKHSKNKIEHAIVLLRNLNVVETSDYVNYSFTSKIDTGLDPAIILKEHVATRQEIKDSHERAHRPSHAAISLAGEPTLYPHISGLVKEFRRRSFTTFIVTNGTTPDIISSMDSLPTQLYLTLPPPNEKLYKKIHRPNVKGMYANIKKTLELLPSLSCRTCLRITLVKGLNGLTDPPLVNGYVKMIDAANPNFLDIKGFSVEARAMFLKKRLGLGGKGDKIGESSEYAPSYVDVFEFAKQLSKAGGYPIVERSRPSRDVLLLVDWPENESIQINHP